MACDPGGRSHGLLLPDGLTTVLALDAARGGFASKVEAHVRRVVNRAGHSVLAVFELAAEALTSALGIQQRLTALAKPIAEDRRVSFRIRVHLGDDIDLSRHYRRVRRFSVGVNTPGG